MSENERKLQKRVDELEREFGWYVFFDLLAALLEAVFDHD